MPKRDGLGRFLNSQLRLEAIELAGKPLTPLPPTPREFGQRLMSVAR